MNFLKRADVVDALEQIADRLIANGFDREALVETCEAYENGSPLFLCLASEKFKMAWKACSFRYGSLTSTLVFEFGVDDDLIVAHYAAPRLALLDTIEKQLNKES